MNTSIVLLEKLDAYVIKFIWVGLYFPQLVYLLGFVLGEPNETLILYKGRKK